MEEQKKSEKKDKIGISALFIPAGLFVGMGWGFLTGQLVAGMYLGLGAGFALFAIFAIFLYLKA